MAKTKETFSKTGSVDIFFIVVNILMIRKLLSFIVNSKPFYRVFGMDLGKGSVVVVGDVAEPGGGGGGAAVGEAVEVAAQEVSHYDGCIEGDEGADVGCEVVGAATFDVKCVGYAVGEAAEYEGRHAEEEGPPVAFCGCGDGCGHYEAAAYGEESAAEPSLVEARGDYAFGGCRNGRGGREGGYGEASEPVHGEHEKERAVAPAPHRPGFSGEEPQLQRHDGDKAESKEDCTCHGAHFKIYGAGNAYAHAAEHTLENDSQHIRNFRQN